MLIVLQMDLAMWGSLETVISLRFSVLGSPC